MNTALALNNNTQPIILKVMSGPNKGDNYKVNAPGAIIGRDPAVCKIVINDARVSRQQCRIDFRTDGITLLDISGKSSTFVNDKAIEYVTLQNNDIIVIGDTKIQFQHSDSPVAVKSTATAKKSFDFFKRNDSTPTPGSAKPALLSKKNLPRIVMAIAVLGGVILFLMPASKKEPPPNVANEQDTETAIENVVKRQEELKKSTSGLSEIQLYNKRKAQEHFIRGFRDFQNQRYTRALEAFQTALATDPAHKTARRYYKLATKKREDMVDYHMDLGNKYKQKSMYKMCVAEFEKVLQIINQPSNKKYILAKEQIKECRLTKQEEF